MYIFKLGQSRHSSFLISVFVLDVCWIRLPPASPALGHRSVFVLWAALASIVRRVSRRRHGVSLPPVSTSRPPQPTAVPAGPGERPPHTRAQTSTDPSTGQSRLERIQHAATPTPSLQHRCSFALHHTTSGFISNRCVQKRQDHGQEFTSSPFIMDL